MRFVIGSEKMQKIAKHAAQGIGFWWAASTAVFSLPGDAK
jgi:hypothetical protein